MAKKSTTKSASNKEVTLKVKLSPSEHKNVRIAAAEREMTIAEFLRESVLSCAGFAVEKYYQREIISKQKTHGSKPHEK